MSFNLWNKNKLTLFELLLHDILTKAKTETPNEMELTTSCDYEDNLPVLGIWLIPK